MQKINRISDEILSNGDLAQIFAKKFGRVPFGGGCGGEISKRKTKSDDKWMKKETPEEKHTPNYIFFDIAPIPDRYYLLYEKCVNMGPENETRQRAEWGLLRESKRRFLV